jgi:hypothetical protein
MAEVALSSGPSGAPSAPSDARTRTSEATGEGSATPFVSWPYCSTGSTSSRGSLGSADFLEFVPGVMVVVGKDAAGLPMSRALLPGTAQVERDVGGW